MTVMFGLMETGTCRYKKLKSQYIYLHLNPTQLASHTSPEPFWTKCGFDLVDESLEIAPLSETDQENPIRRHQHAYKIEAQTEVMAGLTEFRDLQALSSRDGPSSDLDEGMDAYSHAHHNLCPAVPPLTDAARLRLATEAQRKRNEAQVAEDKQRQEEEAARQAADTLAHEEAKKVRTAKATQEAHAALTLQAANAAMDKRCLATLANVKTAHDTLARAQATWTQANHAVELAQENYRAAERATHKAEDVHTTSSAQLKALEKGVAIAKGLVTEGTKRVQACSNKVLTDTNTVSELKLVAHGLQTTANQVNLEMVAATKAVVAHKNDATKAAYSIKAV
jgi:hypothetical protein